MVDAEIQRRCECVNARSYIWVKTEYDGHLPNYYCRPLYCGGVLRLPIIANRTHEATGAL